MAEFSCRKRKPAHDCAVAMQKARMVPHAHAHGIWASRARGGCRHCFPGGSHQGQANKVTSAARPHEACSRSKASLVPLVLKPVDLAAGLVLYCMMQRLRQNRRLGSVVHALCLFDLYRISCQGAGRRLGYGGGLAQVLSRCQRCQGFRCFCIPSEERPIRKGEASLRFGETLQTSIPSFARGYDRPLLS